MKPHTLKPDKPEPPKCHFTPMIYSWGDDIARQVDFWECKHCGHTKEISMSYREG